VTTTTGALPYACGSCGRRFVVVHGRHVTNPPRCVCGTELAPAPLQGGVYELRRSRRASRRRLPARTSARGAPPAAEPDLGYGESHGYGPAHGGPTGPGDAPATERTEPEDADRTAERDAHERSDSSAT